MKPSTLLQGITAFGGLHGCCQPALSLPCVARTPCSCCPCSPTPAACCSDLTDAEFGLFLEAEERRINHCQVVLDLLLQAQAAHVKEHQQQQQQGPPAAAAAAAPGKAVSTRGATDRLSARLAYLIAEQHVETHNLTAARKLLLQVVYTYRRCVCGTAWRHMRADMCWCVGIPGRTYRHILYRRFLC